jgi:hypothetical protein
MIWYYLLLIITATFVVAAVFTPWFMCRQRTLQYRAVRRAGYFVQPKVATIPLLTPQAPAISVTSGLVVYQSPANLTRRYVICIYKEDSMRETPPWYPYGSNTMAFLTPPDNPEQRRGPWCVLVSDTITQLQYNSPVRLLFPIEMVSSTQLASPTEIPSFTEYQPLLAPGSESSLTIPDLRTATSSDNEPVLPSEKVLHYFTPVVNSTTTTGFVGYPDNTSTTPPFYWYMQLQHQVMYVTVARTPFYVTALRLTSVKESASLFQFSSV